MISENGEQLGIVSFKDALARARDVGLDLVAVGINANPMVCKIMDYGKYSYDKQKKQQRSKKSQKIIKVKELKLRPRIADNDYNTKIKLARKFLEEKNKVKFNVFFRGRELDKKELIEQLLERIKEDLADYGSMEGSADYQGRRMSFSFVPNK